MLKLHFLHINQNFVGGDPLVFSKIQQNGEALEKKWKWINSMASQAF